MTEKSPKDMMVLVVFFFPQYLGRGQGLSECHIPRKSTEIPEQQWKNILARLQAYKHSYLGDWGRKTTRSKLPS